LFEKTYTPTRLKDVRNALEEIEEVKEGSSGEGGVGGGVGTPAHVIVTGLKRDLSGPSDWPEILEEREERRRKKEQDKDN